MNTRARVAGRIGLTLLACATAHAAAADTIYRCTDADGGVTLQNAQPCAAGQRQTVVAVDVPPPFPAFVPPPVAEAGGLAVRPVTLVEDADEPADIADQDAVGADATTGSTPPPPLFLCRRWDDERYITAEATPATRCRPLDTVGIGGLPDLGAGRACERVEDVCEPVPDEALCRTWSNRVQEAAFRWRMAPRGVDARDRQAEHARLAAVYEGSTCADR